MKFRPLPLAFVFTFLPFKLQHSHAIVDLERPPNREGYVTQARENQAKDSPFTIINSKNTEDHLRTSSSKKFSIDPGLENLCKDILDSPCSGMQSQPQHSLPCQSSQLHPNSNSDFKLNPFAIPFTKSVKQNEQTGLASIPQSTTKKSSAVEPKTAQKVSQGWVCHLCTYWNLGVTFCTNCGQARTLNG